MPVEPGTVDANVLVYAMDEEAPQHAASRALVDAARVSSVTLYVTSQILCEFYSVVTNPRRVTAAHSPSDALQVISTLLAFPGIRVLPAPASAVRGWMNLLQRQPVKGADVFDLQLVAIMLANDIKRIYTFNTADFDVFPEFAVAVP
jgi:toxin-antitoxin system PIN domain toxin